MTNDFFERLGLPRRFVVDAAALEREYLARSRAVHPDYHAAGPTADLAASTDLSAALNEAYTTLKDPLRRAEHLLALEGGPAAAGSKEMAPSFLLEMMDLREAVEAARGGGTADRLGADLMSRLAALIHDFANEFEAVDGPHRAKALTTIRRRLNEARTLQSLLRDLTAD